MFAVPGWSVGASAPKRQTETDVRRADAGAAPAEGKGRKRKRKSAGGANVTDGNVEKRWQQAFEKGSSKVDQKSATPSSKKAKKSKNGKTDKHPNANNEPLGESRIPKAEASPDDDEDNEPIAAAPMPAPVKPATKPASDVLAPPPALTPLQQKMRQKLISARFRHLNETLYTTPSSSSLSLFSESPSIFEDYHAGFRQQVSVWPENPLDVFINAIELRAKAKDPRKAGKFRKGKGEDVVSEANGGPEQVEMLPRTGGTCTIADLGCGDAQLAQRLTKSGTVRKRALKVLSFDLAAPNEFITKADVAKLPLGEGKVDVAVFCLALMGTNWIDFVEEAWRVLRWKGELWVAEIKSRFGRREGRDRVVDHSVGKRRKLGKKDRKGEEERERNEEEELKMEVDGVERKDETDVSAFVDVLARRGFVLKKGQQSIDLSNKMFVRMEFAKAAPPTMGKNVKQEAKAVEKGGKIKRFIDAEEVDVEAESKELGNAARESSNERCGLYLDKFANEHSHLPPTNTARELSNKLDALYKKLETLLYRLDKLDTISDKLNTISDKVDNVSNGLDVLSDKYRISTDNIDIVLNNAEL
ncbi:hypothetical protein B9Z65_8399 [Elsinoe australis]|uniref:Ribosomal RNA-processing protein 8 n=1 Tax=Elsinoe australis TaxID=40998 RepID=A0A2P7YDM8_9PEZI|nr:hypothetical protein B9Z65_8399 [Elsinoe australis]